MAKKTPLVEGSTYKYFDPDKDRITIKFDISKQWDIWQRFLSHEKSFRYIYTNKQGFKFTFSAYKEARPSFGNKDKPIFVWVAQKRVEGNLRKVYLGVNSNLTPKKLQQTALKISQAKMFKK